MLDDTIRTKVEHYCAYQERCHTEVISKLYELKCPHEDIDEYVAYLIEENFLNEMRYTEQYVIGKYKVKKWGRNKIAYQLKLKKVSDYCIRKALMLIDDDQYIEQMLTLMEKKFKELKSDSPLIQKKKVYAYMIQKGYESDLILSHTPR